MNNKRILSIIANPLTSVPPPLNSAKVLSKNNYQVLVVGYNDGENKKLEKISQGAWLLRINLKSRGIKINLFRRIFATVEFIWRSLIIIKRLDPGLVILFNEIGSIILRLIRRKAVVKISWFLEYPESFTHSFGENIIHNLAFKFISGADLLVFPTQVRKAMAFVRQPELIHRRSIVVHNAPCLEDPARQRSPDLSVSFNNAVSFLNRDETSIRIVYAGAVGNRYGWDSLIKAIGSGKVNSRLLILGVRHELGMREFQEAIETCPDKDRIFWNGPVPYTELYEILQHADVGFVVYRGDNLNTFFSAPGKIYEYLKAGLVLLTDNDCCIFDDILHSNAGIFFQRPFNESDLLQSLSGLSRGEMGKMKTNSKNLFLQKYNMEFQMSPLMKWLEQYER
jgi:hypothetical protein